MKPFSLATLSILSSLLAAQVALFGLPSSAAAVEVDKITQLASVPPRLSAANIKVRLSTLPDWNQVGNALVYEQVFEDFVAAIAFVNRLVEPAEQLGHHPEIAINYNRVTLRLTTHDAGGLTELDFQLAQQINQVEQGR